MFRHIALSTAVAGALLTAPLSSAFAHDHWHRGPGLVGAAILGTAAVVATAAAVATAPLAVVAPPPAPVIVAPRPVIAYAPPAPVVYAAPVYAYSPYYGYYRVR
jgi:hypothetical protein